MKGLLHLLVLLTLTAALCLPGCGRKEEEEEPAPQVEVEAPAEPETVVTPENAVAPTEPTAPMAPTEPALAPSEPALTAPALTAPATPALEPAPAAPSAPAEMVASDAGYEAWFKKHQLDLNDPKMLDADPDGDGVTNRDEFMADTDPRAPGARPGFHPTMRLKQFSEVRLPLMLESVEGSSARIRRLDEPQARTETVKTGDTLRGLPFKVGRIVSKRGTDKAGEQVDASRVTLENPVTKEQTVLVKDMPARSAASHAVLVSADGAATIRVQIGEVFAWPGETGVTYKVIDLRENQAVLEEVETGKMVTVARK